MKTTQELLDEFAREIGCRELTLEASIDSHRRLRKLRQEYSKDLQKIHEEERSRAYGFAKEFALEFNYISVEKLREMSVKELVDFLAE